MKMILLRFVGGGGLLFTLWLIGLLVFSHFIPLSPEPLKIPTEGMVIFTGGKTRLQTALALFEQKKSKYLLISGVNPISSLKDVLGEAMMDPHITLGYKALDTLGNAQETATWVRANHIKTLRLITSNYHMPRSLFELRHLLPDVYIVPEPVIGRGFLTPLWWQHRSVLMLVVHEYNKFLFAVIRHLLEDIRKSLG